MSFELHQVFLGLHEDARCLLHAASKNAKSKKLLRASYLVFLQARLCIMALTTDRLPHYELHVPYLLIALVL